MTKNQLIETIGAHAAELRSMGVKSLALFGSAARGLRGLIEDYMLQTDFAYRCI